MAGTDKTRAPVTGGPCVILVEPQLGENIGAAARAMLNFGLTELRLVRPRDGWPNEKAAAMAAGAAGVVENARLCDTTEEAIADLHLVLAATARDRFMVKPVLTPAEAARQLRELYSGGGKGGLLMGPERSGLSNDDTALATSIVTIPVNPAFASLNLAQAVAVLAYEWFKAGENRPAERVSLRRTRPATQQELQGLFEHLESALTASGFLSPPEKRPGMVRNLRSMIHRMSPTRQDVQTLRGMLASLMRHRE
ncbi:MAG: RNA methyltransferase [Alphaproteobacteria bacterium]